MYTHLLFPFFFLPLLLQLQQLPSFASAAVKECDVNLDHHIKNPRDCHILAAFYRTHETPHRPLTFTRFPPSPRGDDVIPLPYHKTFHSCAIGIAINPAMGHEDRATWWDIGTEMDAIFTHCLTHLVNLGGRAVLGFGMRLTLIMVNPDGVKEGLRNLTMGMNNMTGWDRSEAQARRLLEMDVEDVAVARKGRRRRETEDRD
ncbi:MAG: hypothetical protein LQ351_007822 [Letrouitia transgressa]|nr:MAG: hypothetical protein LQ351_007822 [Letrouitia transgressa]